MSTGYDDKKMIEFFDSVEIVNEEIEEARYHIHFDDGCSFTLSLSPYDELASVTLMRKDQESWLFDIAIERLSWIVFEENTIKFYKDKRKIPSIVVTVRPYVFLWCKAGEPLPQLDLRGEK